MLNPIKTRVWVRHYGRKKWSKDRLQNLMDLHSHLLTIFANKTKSNNQILQNRYYFVLPTPQSSDRWTVIGVKMLFTAIAAHSQGEMLEHSMAATDTSVVEEKKSMESPRVQWAKPSAVTTWIGIPIWGHQPRMAAWQRGLAPLRSDRKTGMANPGVRVRAVERFSKCVDFASWASKLFALPYLGKLIPDFFMISMWLICNVSSIAIIDIETWALAGSRGMWMEAIMWYSHTLPPNTYIATQPPKYVYTRVLGKYVNIT